MAFWRKQPPPPPTLRQRLTSYLPAAFQPPPQPRAGGWLRSPFVQRSLQFIGLADLAIDSGPREDAGYIAAARAASLGVIVLALRKSVRDIRDLKPAWPILLPLLVWVGLRSFQDERRRMRRRAG